MGEDALMGSLPLRTRAAVLAGRATAGVSRRAGRGGGSVIGGRVTLALDPRALERLSVGRRVGLVTGTNGKTTTTRLLVAALATAGPVGTNSAGANLLGGLVAGLSGGGGGGGTDALEVDEGLLAQAVLAIGPEVVVLLNLSRDQLDRIGEVRIHAEAWQRSLASSPGTAVVANADDPLVTWAALAGGSATWVATGQRWREDAATCPACGERILWSDEAVSGSGAEVAGHPSGVSGGHWACTGCDLARPRPDLTVAGDEIVTAGGLRVPVELLLPGSFNRANAAMAAAAAERLGVDFDVAIAAMSTLGTVEGRYQTLPVDGARVRLLLAKNPAGWAETLDLIRVAVPVVVGINARVADGRDPSWLWDVPFERLEGRMVVATGDRGRDLAVRLRYANVDHEFVPGYRDAVRVAAASRVGAAFEDGVGGGEVEVDLAANYTSFQDARKELARGS